ncbi:hypothetical protein F4814DRAFT_410332 [Daldinia grandis]|nr:hypothetical protein F4814DRAFT_410332 [Daldinia grandis]
MISNSATPQSLSSPVEFASFPLLPAELRFKIWNEAFPPRVVEIHSQWDANNVWRHLAWVSNSDNPAVMSVCSESRTLALEHFTILLPVFRSEPNTSISRYLYFSPTSDLLVLLGEVDHIRLSDIFRTIQQRDPAHRGLRRVGVSLSCWAHNFNYSALKVWKKAILAELEDLVLIMYDEQKPPASFRHGEVGLELAIGMDSLARIFETNLQHFFNFGHFRIMNLTFSAKPAPRGIDSTVAG